MAAPACATADHQLPVTCLDDVLFEKKGGKYFAKQRRREADMEHDTGLTADGAEVASRGEPFRSSVQDNHLGLGGALPQLRHDTFRFVTANVCTLNPGDAKYTGGARREAAQ